MNENTIGEALKNTTVSSQIDVHYEPVAHEPPADPIFKWLGVQFLAFAYVAVIVGVIIFLLKAGT